MSYSEVLLLHTVQQNEKPHVQTTMGDFTLIFDTRYIHIDGYSDMSKMG
jgi:hypothetical protein